MRNPIIYACLALFLFGCGKSSSDARSLDEYRKSIQESKELTEIDADLDALQAETDTLKDSYQEIQATILPHVKLESETEQVQKLSVYINENSVIIVNDTPMSRNDFTTYIGKNLPTLCTPAPTLKIHTKAMYDTAAWVLDSIYSHGCTDVTIE